MTLRFTEQQFADYQERFKLNRSGTSCKRNKPVKNHCVDNEYDLPTYIVSGIEMGLQTAPASPLIVTLKNGLKDLQNPSIERKPYERIEQALALVWLECNAPYPFSLTTSTPFGGFRPNGAGGQMKGEGAKKGYPDILMDLPRKNFHGLRIELKRFDRQAVLSEDQKSWLTLLAAENYCAVQCWGHQAVIKVFSDYLDIGCRCEPPGWTIKYF